MLLVGCILLALAALNGLADSESLRAQTMPPITPVPTDEGTLPPTATAMPTATPTDVPGGTLPPTATTMPTATNMPLPPATPTPPGVTPSATPLPSPTPTATPLPMLAPLVLAISDSEVVPGDTLLITIDRANLPVNAKQLVAILPPDARFSADGSTPGWFCQEADDSAIFCTLDLAETDANPLTLAVDIDPVLASSSLSELAIDLFAQDSDGNILVGTRVVVTVNRSALPRDIYLPLIAGRE